MIFPAGVIFSIIIMITLYGQDSEITTVSANILIYGLYVLQIIALFFHVLLSTNKLNKKYYVVIYTSGAIFGAFWSRCVAYSEGISFFNTQTIYTLNTIFSAILFGAIYSVIAVYFKKIITRYFKVK